MSTNVSNNPSGVTVLKDPGYDVAECIIDVTAPLPPDFNDWPSHMQDKVFLALADLATKTQKPYELARVSCEKDWDTGGYYVKMIATARRKLNTLN